MTCPYCGDAAVDPNETCSKPACEADDLEALVAGDPSLTGAELNEGATL